MLVPRTARTGRALRLALPGFVLLLLAALVAPVGYAQQQTAVDPRFFPQTGYRVASDAFWRYFQARGGVRTLGYPVSRAFPFLNCTTQVFQRIVLQQCGSGGVQPLNLLDEGLLPFTRFNGSVVPAPDPELLRQAPQPNQADYATSVVAFVQRVAPDTLDSDPVRFFSSFQGAVSLLEAFPDGRGEAGLLPLLNLELWGLPTSKPQRDPANASFVYQRFQRGIMHYDRGTGRTQSLLLGDAFKSVLTGEHLAPDLEAQARTSRLLRQYASGKPSSLARPSDLPGTDLTDAFTPMKAEPPPAASLAADRLVLGYYVPYDATSWASLQANPRGLDVVAGQWVTIDACGNLGSRDNQTVKQFARANGIKMLPSLLTSSAWLNHRLLTEEDVASRAVEQIVEYTVSEGYDGFDLDLEGVDPDDRDALSAFVARVGAALHAQGKLFTLAIPPKDRDVTVGWAGAYDYAALGAAADLVTIMTYEYNGPFSGPGAVAPYAPVERALAFATSQIEPRKVLLGLAFYGYDWNVTSGGTRALGYPQAAAIAERYGTPLTMDPTTQSATLRYEAPAGDPIPAAPGVPAPRHEITVRTPPPCDVQPPPSPSRPAPRPTPPPDAIQEHHVWLEESNSAEARLGLATRYGAGGVATWRLGFEDPRVWEVFDAWRTRQR